MHFTSFGSGFSCKADRDFHGEGLSVGAPYLDAGEPQGYRGDWHLRRLMETVCECCNLEGKMRKKHRWCQEGECLAVPGHMLSVFQLGKVLSNLT